MDSVVGWAFGMQAGTPIWAPTTGNVKECDGRSELTPCRSNRIPGQFLASSDAPVHLLLHTFWHFRRRLYNPFHLLLVE